MGGRWSTLEWAGGKSGPSRAKARPDEAGRVAASIGTVKTADTMQPQKHWPFAQQPLSLSWGLAGSAGPGLMAEDAAAMPS